MMSLGHNTLVLYGDWLEEANFEYAPKLRKRTQRRQPDDCFHCDLKVTKKTARITTFKVALQKLLKKLAVQRK